MSIHKLSNGTQVPVHTLNTVIVGAGAAGMNCAVHLYEFMRDAGVDNPEKRIAIVTAGVELGASRMSGSDKQTYYKLGTSPTVADSAVDFAKTLTAFGCAHGDVALAEGQSSLREFYHLVQAGVPFPHDAEGAYIGYKTDHDPYERATSAGPKTSKYMSECLQRQAERYGVRIFDGHELVHIITTGTSDCRRITGIITLDKSKLNEPSYGLTVFLCENVVLAAGGPGDLYEVSAYPEGQTGIHGLALAAGLKAHNLTESQFGLASTSFRWNVSGTYMQVIPRIFSTDTNGNDEQEFLAPYFDTTAKMAANIFLKGYQWPFDPQRILNQQSSLIDVLVYYETQVLGRRVYMDFTKNPIPGKGKEPFDLLTIDEEAFAYLQRNEALQPTPIERLAHMNSLAIDIYSENGIDIHTQPLEINVCAQHSNGGFVVDKWWQSNIPHAFVIGEMAGTHGVKRPGGSALNAGQVGGLRAAEYIARVYGAGVPSSETDAGIVGQVEELLKKLNKLAQGSVGIDPGDAIKQIQRNMSLYGGHIRELQTAKSAAQDARRLYKRIRAGDVRIKDSSDIISAIRAEHLALTAAAFLGAAVEYIESGGGSRGSFMILCKDGGIIHPSLINPATQSPYAFAAENEELRNTIAEVEVQSLDDCTFNLRRVPVRSIPLRNDVFELAWAAYRTGEVYRKQRMQTGKLPPDLLNKLLSTARTDAGVLVGPAYGEDAAAVRFGGRVLVAASDPVTFTTDRIGYYTVSVNANDIAVMGAIPRWFLATILLPVGSTEETAESVFNEIAQACRNLGVSLVGGHTEITDSVSRIVVSGCMLGETDEASLIRTGGARPGDEIILAGSIAIEGASILAKEASDELRAKGIGGKMISAAASYLDDPGICIVPYAQAAIETGGVTAMHDPTEGGVASALRELAAASGCGLRIDRDAVPVMDTCAAFCEALGLDPLGLIASGCLLIAVSPDRSEAVTSRLQNIGAPAHRIGVLTNAIEGVKFSDGTDLPSFARDEIARFFDERE